MFFIFFKRHKKISVSSDHIFNLDETNVSAVFDTPNVVAQKGTKQVGQCVSVVRRPMITILMSRSATSQIVSPIFIFLIAE